MPRGGSPGQGQQGRGNDGSLGGNNNNGGNGNGGRKRGRSGRDNYTPSQSQIDRSRAARPGQTVGGRGGVADSLASRFESSVGNRVSNALDAIGLGPRADFAARQARGGEGGRQALRTFGSIALSSINPIAGLAFAGANLAYDAYTGRSKTGSRIGSLAGLAGPGGAVLGAGYDLARDEANRGLVEATADQPPASLATRSGKPQQATNVSDFQPATGRISALTEPNRPTTTPVTRTSQPTVSRFEPTTSLAVTPDTTLEEITGVSPVVSDYPLTSRQDIGRRARVDVGAPTRRGTRPDLDLGVPAGRTRVGRPAIDQAPNIGNVDLARSPTLSLEAAKLADPSLAAKIEAANTTNRFRSQTVLAGQAPATVADVPIADDVTDLAIGHALNFGLPAAGGLAVKGAGLALGKIGRGLSRKGLAQRNVSDFLGGVPGTAVSKEFGMQTVKAGKKAFPDAAEDASLAANLLGFRTSFQGAKVSKAGQVTRASQPAGTGAGAVATQVGTKTVQTATQTGTKVATSKAPSAPTSRLDNAIKSGRRPDAINPTRAAPPAAAAPLASRFEEAEAAPEQGQREGQQPDQRGVQEGTYGISEKAQEQLGARIDTSPQGDKPGNEQDLGDETSPEKEPTAGLPEAPNIPQAPPSRFDEEYSPTGRKRGADIGPRGGRIGTDSRGNVVEIMPDGTVIPIPLHNLPQRGAQTQQQAGYRRPSAATDIYRRFYRGGAFGIQPVIGPRG